MLRLLVLLLLLANAAYFVWAQGLLAPWGAGPAQQSEPHRLEQQIHPEAVRVLHEEQVRRADPPAAGAVVAASAKLPECLQAGLFNDKEAENLRQALNAWAPGTWSLEPGTEAARWIVYMGKYPDADNVEKKKAQLRYLGVSFQPPGNPAFEPGLSLGGYPTEAAARQQLEALAQKGVRTARVVQERPEHKGFWLKLPALDDGLRPRVDEIKSALIGRPLRACR